MSTFVTLSGGEAWALRLDGIIYRTGHVLLSSPHRHAYLTQTRDTASGNMIAIEDSTDFEMYSSTSEGAIQGYGYVFHAGETDRLNTLKERTDTQKEDEYGPRILRLVNVVDFSIHDIALVDGKYQSTMGPSEASWFFADTCIAGAFHLVMDTCSNGEVYNMAIAGANEGGLDGIDVWGDNIYIHDIEVSNKDECVTVKSPASNMLIEDIYCNWSGGCAIGSLGTNTKISNIVYNNVYTWSSNQMMLIKSNGGNGTVSNLQFNNFIGISNAYSLDIDTSWSSLALQPGGGITFEDIVSNY